MPDATNTHRYFTTPAYYASGLPHAGHVYATLLTLTLGRHWQNRGLAVKTLTGMDEHGEKIERKSKEFGVPPQRFVDDLYKQWTESLKALGLEADTCVRTTSSAHIKTVQEILSRCHAKGDIYYGEHSGHYCVDCEAFLTPLEMDNEHHCLVHKKPTEMRQEGNYYFRTTKYTEAIKKSLEQGSLIHPKQQRFANELMGMLNSLTTDLSISRPKSRSQWGIELPFDTHHITYVWFDALPNYITGLGGLEAAYTSPYWANAHHIIGKDILKFHGIFWPAMLLSLGLPLPRLVVTGWLMSDGHKMSKSLGNTITVEDISSWGIDAFANSALRLAPLGEDISLSSGLVRERFNADLANGVANLYSRTSTLVAKGLGGVVPPWPSGAPTPQETALLEALAKLPHVVAQSFEAFQPQEALAALGEVVRLTDKYIGEEKPWVYLKDNRAEDLSRVMAYALAALRVVGLLSYPFFPEKMLLMLKAMGDTSPLESFWKESLQAGKLSSGSLLDASLKLYARWEAVAAPAPKKGDVAPGSPQLPGSLEAAAPSQEKDVERISLTDFQKAQVRVGTVVHAHTVEGSDRLLRLLVHLGPLGEKQIFAGLKAWVKPEDIAGRKVLVVANLTLRKMKFGMSEGMVLSCEGDDGHVTPIYVDPNLPDGALLS